MSAVKVRALSKKDLKGPHVEKWRHKNVFETYLLMGPSRTLPALAQNVNIPHGTLMKWSRIFRWTDRLAKRDDKAMMCIEAENDKLYKDVIKSRQQQAYQSLQEKSLKFIEDKASTFLTSKTAVRDAAIALDIGIKGERQVLGWSDSKLKAGFVKEGFAAFVELIDAK